MVCCECGDFCSNLKDCLPLDSCCDFLGKTCSACDCGKICDCIKECDICCAVADCLKGAGSFVGDLIGWKCYRYVLLKYKLLKNLICHYSVEKPNFARFYLNKVIIKVN